MRPGRPTPATHRAAFTLVELLVVLAIIGLVAVATLPVVLGSMQQGAINEAARQLHGELAQARDRAIQANAPRGFRLIPDAYDPTIGILTYSHLQAIEPAPDYTDGRLHDLSNAVLTTGNAEPFRPVQPLPPAPGFSQLTHFFEFAPGDFRYDDRAINGPLCQIPYSYAYAPTGFRFRTWSVVAESKYSNVSGVVLPNDPTSWYWNIRQGEKIRIENAGGLHTIAGPIQPLLVASQVVNPERFVNFGQPTAYQSYPGNAVYEFLIVLDGIDNDGDGFTDEQFDGINNDGDFYPAGHPLAGRPVIDPGFNGIDDNLDGQIDEPLEMFLHFNPDGSVIYNPFFSEYEPEGPLTSSQTALRYTINRRPVPTPNSREIALPTGVVIDATTFDSRPPFVPERSRVPVDPYTLFVDILVAPDGKAVQMAANANPAPPMEFAFYHFWLADADGVNAPFDAAQLQQMGNYRFRLPMPAGTTGDPQINPMTYTQDVYPPGLPTLRGNRRLLSVNTKTGQIATTSVETFATNNPSRPFQDAQAGSKEEP
jgi:prepilin-type N-terminal cleavage/methylation domain-containing protein